MKIGSQYGTNISVYRQVQNSPVMKEGQIVQVTPHIRMRVLFITSDAHCILTVVHLHQQYRCRLISERKYIFTSSLITSVPYGWFLWNSIRRLPQTKHFHINKDQLFWNLSSVLVCKAQCNGFSFPPQHPDRHCGTFSLLTNWYRQLLCVD